MSQPHLGGIMGSFLMKSIVLSTAIFMCSECRIFAFCSKCVKIEEDRAREQAKNPQPIRYYDEFADADRKKNIKKDPTPRHSTPKDSFSDNLENSSIEEDES